MIKTEAQRGDTNLVSHSQLELGPELEPDLKTYSKHAVHGVMAAVLPSSLVLPLSQVPFRTPRLER
jgi:hypothetical protein